MSVTEVRGDASSGAQEKNVDLKLEVVVIPVSMSAVPRVLLELDGARCRLPFR